MFTSSYDPHWRVAATAMCTLVNVCCGHMYIFCTFCSLSWTPPRPPVVLYYHHPPPQYCVFYSIPTFSTLALLYAWFYLLATYNADSTWTYWVIGLTISLIPDFDGNISHMTNSMNEHCSNDYVKLIYKLQVQNSQVRDSSLKNCQFPSKIVCT